MSVVLADVQRSGKGSWVPDGTAGDTGMDKMFWSTVALPVQEHPGAPQCL